MSAGYHEVDSDNHDQVTAIGYRTENRVTVVSIEKSKNVVCEICSSTLKSMKYLERHMKSVHRGTCFYCFECGKKPHLLNGDGLFCYFLQ